MKPTRLSIFLCLSSASLIALPNCFSQSQAQKAASIYRNSTVFLKVQKITSTGSIIEEQGSGFVISEKGHILTSCHVVNEFAYDVKGNVLLTKIDKVEIFGSVGSRFAPAEPIKFLKCESDGFDLALLKFKNNAASRKPIPAVSQYEIGEDVFSLGFPAGNDFSVRPGTIGGETEDDLNTVNIVLNPGDSGGPILNKTLDVVALVQGALTNTPTTGVVRPIRHASQLFAIAGVTLARTDVNFSETQSAPNVLNSKVLFINPQKGMADFLRGKPLKDINSSQKTIDVVYPVAAEVSKGEIDPSVANVTVTEVKAKPGYTIKDAQFIVTDAKGAEVSTVIPVSKGKVARAAFIPTDANKTDTDAFVTGFIRTVQEREER